MCTGTHSLFGVAFHQTELFQAIGHQTANGEVAVHILHTGLCNVQNQVVAVLYNRIDVELSLCVLTANRHRAGVVGAIVVNGLGTTVAQGKSSGLERAQRGSTMHNLAMLRENRGEAHLSTIAMGDAIHLSGNEFLSDARSDETHSGGMHLVADFGSTLQFFNLFLCLGRAHLYYCHDQLHRCSLLLFRRVEAQQVHDLNLDVMAVRRQKMNGATFGAGLVADGLQLSHRCRVGNTHLRCHVGHALNGTIPDDVFDVDVIADEAFAVVVDVDDAYQSVALLTEVIEERRVLTERIIGIIWIVIGRLVIAKQHDDTLAHKPFQLVTALQIGFLAEHIVVFLFYQGTKVVIFLNIK